MYRYFRYFALGLFVICNTIITTSAVWNLSLILGRDWSVPRRSDGYSIFVGCAGLVFIFPVFFCELAKKDTFLTKVWFELLWLAVFCALQLAGAAVATAAGVDHLCQSPAITVIDPGFKLRCLSSQLLQGFSWMCSLTLLLYFLLLVVFTLLKARDDPTIWHCNVRQFPWNDTLFLLPNTPSSPTGAVARKSSKISLPRFRRTTPIIVAPRPRRAVNDEAIQEAILAYRSGLSSEYEIEHFHPGAHYLISRPGPAVTMPPQCDPMVAEHERLTSLYPEHMRRALANLSTPPVSAQAEDPPSPNPIGNWPQLNPPLRRPGDKRTARQATQSSHLRSLSGRANGNVSSNPLPLAVVRSASFPSRPSGPRRPSTRDTTRPSAYNQNGATSPTEDTFTQYR